MTVPDVPDELLTTSEVAVWLRRSPDRVRQWRFEQVGPAYVRDDDTGGIWYSRRAVQAWIDARTIDHG